MAERQKQQMKRERKDAVLCHQRCKIPRLTASERNPGVKSASHEAKGLFAALRNVPQLVPRRNSTYTSMHRTSIICWEYVPYYPTGKANTSLQIVEYRLTHKCLSQTFNTTEHSAHYLEWVRVRLEKLTDTLMPLPRTHNTTPSPTFPPQMVVVGSKKLELHPDTDIMRAAAPLHLKTKRCLLKLIQLLGTSVLDPLVVVVFQHLSPC